MTLPTDNDEPLRLQAEQCMQNGSFAEAVTLYRELVAAHPEEDSYLLALAWACHDDGALTEATDCFESLFAKELSRRVFTGFAFDELVRIYKELASYDRLVDVCRRACTAQPEDYALMTELGESYLMAERPDEAIAVFRKMTEMEPDDTMAFCRLGNALVRRKAFDQAEAAYASAAAIDPDATATFYGRLAGVYLQAEEAERAESALRRCVQAKPEETIYYCNLGDVLIRRGCPEEARNAYETAISKKPEDAGVYYNRLGNALKQARYYLQSVEAFKLAIAASPGNPYLYERLADSYQALGMNNLARDAFEQAERHKKSPRG